MEFAIIKVHPEVGADILGTIEFGAPVAGIVRQHHERLDGSGYPDGLTGAQITPEARVLAVADVVEAMASHRPYRPSLGVDAARRVQRIHILESIRPPWWKACLELFAGGFVFGD